MTFEKEIKEYEDLRGKYQTLIINKMDREEYIKYDEVFWLRCGSPWIAHQAC